MDVNENMKDLEDSVSTSLRSHGSYLWQMRDVKEIGRKGSVVLKEYKT